MKSRITFTCHCGYAHTDWHSCTSNPYARYEDDTPTGQPWCDSSLTIEGDWYACDLIPPHNGLAHSNREVQAQWL